MGRCRREQRPPVRTAVPVLHVVRQVHRVGHRVQREEVPDGQVAVPLPRSVAFNDERHARVRTVDAGPVQQANVDDVAHGEPRGTRRRHVDGAGPRRAPVQRRFLRGVLAQRRRTVYCVGGVVSFLCDGDHLVGGGAGFPPRQRGFERQGGEPRRRRHWWWCLWCLCWR